MQRQAVPSSSLRSVGYEAKRHWLEIEFAGGGVYRYFDVPAEVYVELMNAPSLGGFFQSNVRERFDYERLD